jgi:1-acyl-sn-glycerol-3-phosphate acyltransferase
VVISDNDYNANRQALIGDILMSRELLSQRRFLPYFCTQFLGAFNDNVYKNALAILITFSLAVSHKAILQNIALIAFILPFFLFGALAGQLADKFDKAWLIRRIKFAEIIIMLVGCVALSLQSIELMLFVLFCLGAQSAFFGPIKYSILPQHVGKHELLAATGYVEAATFVSILLGTILGGLLAGEGGSLNVLMITMVAIAGVGYVVSCSIPSAPAAAPDLKISLNLWRSTIDIIKMTRANHPVFLSILAISWFWFFGSIVLTQFPTFAREVLYGDAKVATLLLATFSIGIGLGSMACAKLSGGKIEIGLMPIGALGISFFTWQLGSTALPAVAELRTLSELMATDGAWWAIFNMTMMAFSSGIFIVPLYAFMQLRSDDSQRSRVVAVNNIINSIFMVMAGGLAAIMLASGFSVLQIFKVAAVLNLLATLYILSVVPEFFLRLVAWVLIHSVYRIKKQDLSNIPQEGPALLVCNHVSFVDPVIILALGPRPIRFVMYYWFYELPIVKYLFRGLRSIPIASRRESPEVLQAARDSIAKSLDEGHLVCIFPEGGITRNGEIQRFQPGIDEILRRNPVPVIPLALKGLWGTWFSRYKGRALRGLPKAYMKRISLVSGTPVPPDEANRILMYEKVCELRGDEK